MACTIRVPDNAVRLLCLALADALTSRAWIDVHVRSKGPADPSKPGRGGQYEKKPGGWFRDLTAKDGFDPRPTMSRWRVDYQRDFAIRMAWCLPP
ncbi:MAG: hypothetical protein FJ386_14385 [Verrucomicrobia bacterium]|nr:hypothetical protein [Verrucomicrobiota bacterium]